MILIDRVRTGLASPRRDVRRTWVPPVDLDEQAPLIVVLAVGAGLLFLILTTPTASGDYGQWLMTSRYYLGQSVPEYRTISALPPVVPMLLASIRLVVPDPFIALHLLNSLLLIGLAASFYMLGAVLLGDRWAGALSVVLGLFATDRFLELFAFGGLLQVAAVTGMGVSVAAFVRAGREPGVVLRWWLLGTAAVGIAALSHAATGLLAVAVGIVTAGLAATALRGVGWRAQVAALGPFAIMLAGLAAYWLFVLLPGNAEYIANPASMAFRGPDRLFSPLVGQWPSAALLLFGAVGLAVGGLQALLRRRLDGYAVLVAWVAVTWGALAFSMVSATGTDYPRFATLLMAPVAVGASAVSVWLLRRLASIVHIVAPRWSLNSVMAILLIGGVAATAPMVVGRHRQQADYYDLRDAAALTAAATWINETLGPSRQAVLSDVREGKWIEGLTGREALFSQPVRYAFRAAEWQRSVDADALMRSSVALTSGFIGAFFTEAVSAEGHTAPAGLVLRANHRGELLDLLRLSRVDTSIRTNAGPIRASSLVPLRVAESVTHRQVGLSTVWKTREGAPMLTQSVTVWRDGTSLRLRHSSPGHRIAVILRPAGLSITSFEAHGHEATICFRRVADRPPCLRIWLSQADASLRQLSDGALRAETRGSERLDLVVTAVTTGEASVGLNLLYPENLVETRDVGAALLYALDPAFEARAKRLEALGFREAFAAGPYRVLLRQGPPEL